MALIVLPKNVCLSGSQDHMNNRDFRLETSEVDVHKILVKIGVQFLNLKDG